MRKSLRNILNKTEINRDLIMLLIIGGLYSIGIFLSNTFVNVYLWKQAGDYQTIGVYNLAIFIFQPLTFILAGRMAKKFDRIIVLRLGVLFLSLFYLIVLIINEDIAVYNFLLGSILGIGYGFYWLAFNVLTFEITEPETRDFFNGLLGVLQSFGGMIGPITAGAIIAKMSDNIGYTVIFSVSFILFLAAVIFSFFLKRRQANGVFHFKRVLMERKYNKDWHRLLWAHLFQGLREGIFAFVITIWVYLTTQNEFSLGVFNLYFSGFSFIFYLLATKFITPPRRKRSILLGSLLLYGALIFILIKTTYLTLIVYGVIIGIAYPIINVPYVSLTYDVIGKARHAKEMRIEYIVVRELFVNIGRVVSVSIFLFVISYFNSTTSIPLILLVFGAFQVSISLFIKNINLPMMSSSSDEMINEKIPDEKYR